MTTSNKINATELYNWFQTDKSFRVVSVNFQKGSLLIKVGKLGFLEFSIKVFSDGYCYVGTMINQKEHIATYVTPVVNNATDSILYSNGTKNVLENACTGELGNAITSYVAERVDENLRNLLNS